MSQFMGRGTNNYAPWLVRNCYWWERPKSNLISYFNVKNHNYDDTEGAIFLWRTNWESSSTFLWISQQQWCLIVISVEITIKPVLHQELKLVNGEKIANSRTAYAWLKSAYWIVLTRALILFSKRDNSLRRRFLCLIHSLPLLSSVN